MRRPALLLLCLTVNCFPGATNNLPELAILLSRSGLNFIPTDGRVKSFQKIDDLTGGLTGGLEDTGFFGRGSVALGDLDGDGIMDLAASAWADDDGGLDVGAVWILFMNRDGTVRSQQIISLLDGGFGTGLASGDYFGYSLAPLGDVDGDGIPDLAVGAPKANDGGGFRGAAWILLLNRDGTVKSKQKISSLTGFAGINDNDQFASTLAAGGDMDGDGVRDVIVGAPFTDDGGSDHGAVWVIYLNANGTAKTQQKISETSGGFTGTLANLDYFGSEVAMLGDLDGDGVRDLAVGAGSADDGGTDRGATWILFMNSNGTVRSQQKISSTSGGFTGTLADNDLFGSLGMVGPGDLNGDGIPDLVVGAVGSDDGGTDRGSAWVVFLNRNGTVKNQQKISTLEGNFTATLVNSALFGGGSGSLGDLDGDLVPDIVIGASNAPGGGSGRGSMYVLFLAPAP
ncbi:MAG: VCBS repeat-containing protein [Spirochaetia bacterium]|nr:VCBS repeat-containing protein [Spirochaetia bacterium]